MIYTHNLSTSFFIRSIRLEEIANKEACSSNGRNTLSVTRIGGLVHGYDQVLPILEGTQMVKDREDEHMTDGRKIVQLNDYPGSGANNRHTPRPQFGRCVDC
ncbi:unnamed protein product [Dovyalis caffra]|uniref:Uncharacterized protein n=1 Tax=Dovyalis caffra TaxID=77055 RepID=A0AAV1QMB9_9ROSI|nr:unnamed protein product [Dovyalis caffra]